MISDKVGMHMLLITTISSLPIISSHIIKLVDNLFFYRRQKSHNTTHLYIHVCVEISLNMTKKRQAFNNGKPSWSVSTKTDVGLQLSHSFFLFTKKLYLGSIGQ